MCKWVTIKQPKLHQVSFEQCLRPDQNQWFGDYQNKL